jgi:hypothetical protein
MAFLRKLVGSDSKTSAYSEELGELIGLSNYLGPAVSLMTNSVTSSFLDGLAEDLAATDSRSEPTEQKIGNMSTILSAYFL